MTLYTISILIGLTAGILSGFIGIGGGVIMIPALIFFFGYSQHLSQGTTLAAMVPPIGILAALKYYAEGHVNIPVAACISAGFIIGGFIGAKLVMNVDDAVLKKIFAVLMILIGIKTLTGR